MLGLEAEHPSKYMGTLQEPHKLMFIQQRGGARIGNGITPFNCTWPFAVLKVDQERLSLRVKILFFSGEYVIQKCRIERMVEVIGFLSPGIRIEHNDHSQPTQLIFWCFGAKRLLTELRELGYPVEPRD